MSHWPPSCTGSFNKNWINRESVSSLRVIKTFSKKKFDFSNLSHQNKYAWENSNSSNLYLKFQKRWIFEGIIIGFFYFFMRLSRRTFKAAKIQQRPELFWLVTLPSSSTLSEKTWIPSVETWTNQVNKQINCKLHFCICCLLHDEWQQSTSRTETRHSLPTNSLDHYGRLS